MTTFIITFLMMRTSVVLAGAVSCDLSNSITYPVPCLIKSLNNFWRLTGIREFLDGTPSTTMSPLDSNLIVRNQLPSSPDKNHFYMYFAGAAYCFRNLPTLTCPWCGNISSAGYKFLDLISEPFYNTRAFIAVSHDRREIVVSFRGTDNIPNFIEDITFNMISIGPGIAAHRGFWVTTGNIYSDVVNSITAELGRGYKLVVTGHSFGAAIASLFVFRITSEMPFSGTPVELYTYGSPRVGNKAFANYMNGLNIVSSRTTDYADIVPHLFPAAWGYYHHLTEFWIQNASTHLTSGRYCSRRTFEDPTCSYSRGPKYSAIDHFIYFDVNLTQCIETDVLYFLGQLFFNVFDLVPSLRIVIPEINLGTDLSDFLAALQGIKSMKI